MENPFLDNEEEEKVKVYKPVQKETLTEAQKKRNFKGLEKMKEVLKKIGVNIKDYKGVNKVEINRNNITKQKGFQRQVQM